MRHNKHSTKTTESRFLGTISASSIRNLLPSQIFDFLFYLFQFSNSEFFPFLGNKVFWFFHFTGEFCCSKSVWARSIFVLLLNGVFFYFYFFFKFFCMFELIGYWFIYFDWLLRKYWKWNYIMTILQLNPYFKINSWIYRGILGVLVKNSLNLISFSPIPPNFERNENLRF